MGLYVDMTVHFFSSSHIFGRYCLIRGYKAHVGVTVIA